jgi:hypothetical protein
MPMWLLIIAAYCATGAILAKGSTGIAAYIYVTLFWPLAFVPWEKLGLD